MRAKSALPLRHEDVAEELEDQAQSEVGERLHQIASKALRVENSRTAIGAGGKIIQVVEAVIMALARHAGMLQLETAPMPHHGMYTPPA